jgi:hypothetical protein
MTTRVHCGTCEKLVHPTDPHSCFSAAAHREYREAEEAVIEAAKVLRDTASVSSEWYTAIDRLEDAVDALRAQGV